MGGDTCSVISHQQRGKEKKGGGEDTNEELSHTKQVHTARQIKKQNKTGTCKATSFPSRIIPYQRAPFFAKKNRLKKKMNT